MKDDNQKKEEAGRISQEIDDLLKKENGLYPNEQANIRSVIFAWVLIHDMRGFLTTDAEKFSGLKISKEWIKETREKTLKQIRYNDFYTKVLRWVNKNYPKG